MCISPLKVKGRALFSGTLGFLAFFTIFNIFLSLTARAGELEIFDTLFRVKNIAIWHLKRADDQGKAAFNLQEINDKIASEGECFLDSIREKCFIETDFLLYSVHEIDKHIANSEKYGDLALEELIVELNNISKSFNISWLSQGDQDAINHMVTRGDYVSLKLDDFYKEPDFSKYISSIIKEDKDRIWLMGREDGLFEIWSFDPEKGFIKEKAALGQSILSGRYRIGQSLTGDLELTGASGKSMGLKLLSFDSSGARNGVSRNNVTSTMKIVPAFSDKTEYRVEKGGSLTVHLKVMDGNKLVKTVNLKQGNNILKPDKNGIIAISWDSGQLSTSPKTVRVTLQNKVSTFIDLKVSSGPRTAIWSNDAFLGTGVNVGFSPGIAELSVSLNKGNSGSISYIAPNVQDKTKDQISMSFSPSLTLGATATIGPKIQLFKVDVLGKNLGAEAGAYVGATVKAGAGFNQSYLFPAPRDREQVKAQLTILSYQIGSALSPAIALLLKPAVEKLSGVRFKDYNTGRSLYLTGSSRIYGTVKAYLGLKDPPGENSNSQANLTLANASAGMTLSSRIEGGVSGGIDPNTMKPMGEKYFVSLKGDITGDYNADFLAMKIFNLSLPKLFSESGKASCVTGLTFRFDKDKKLETCLVNVGVAYEILHISASKSVKELVTWLRDNGANATDYVEISNVKGISRSVVFIIDKKNTEKYFAEWAGFARELLDQNKEQNQNTVVARVKGLTGAYAEIFKNMAAVPLPYTSKTSLVTKLSKPGLGIDISVGVRVGLGINAMYKKSKTFVTEKGTLSSFVFYPAEQYDYDVIMARSDRDITEMMDVWTDYLADEMREAAGYVWKKAKDGTLYLIREAEETIFVIKKKVDGTVEVAQKVGQEAKKFMQSVWNTLADGYNATVSAGTELASGVADAVSSAWNWIWN